MLKDFYQLFHLNEGEKVDKISPNILENSSKKKIIQLLFDQFLSEYLFVYFSDKKAGMRLFLIILIIITILSIVLSLIYDLSHFKPK